MSIDHNNDPFWNAYTPLNDKLTKEGQKATKLAYTKPENQWPYENCDTYKGVSAILAPDAVLLDADDQDNSELLLKVIQGEGLKCRVTDRDGGRGIHADFLDRQARIKKNATKVMLACGIVVDIKIGRKNGLECIRWQGVERRTVYDEAPYQDIPCWLLPVDTMIDFQSMGEGDGRNETLFSYILALQRNGLTVEEIRQTIRITNKYVLREPVDDRELDTILRDDAFMKGCFFKGNRFLHDQFAEYIMRNYNVCLVWDQLCIYQDGIYSPVINTLEKAIAKELPQLTDTQIKEVTKRLRLICPHKKLSRPTLIAFSNGLYDLETDDFREFSPNEVILNRIPWPYNPAAYSELLDRTLNQMACDDPGIRALMEEVAGYCLYRRNELGKFFVLIGDKSNGKSTFLYIVNNMLGDINVVSIDLKDLGNRFKTAELFGKLANIGDDIGDEFIADASVLRKLTTGEKLNVERKGQDPFDLFNYAALLFSANAVPRIRDKTGAIQRRIVIVPFDATFTPDDPGYNSTLRYDLSQQEHTEYLIRLALDGLKRVLKNQRFTEPQRVKAANKEYEEYNNPIIGFIAETDRDDILNEPTKDIYHKYNLYCNLNGLTPLSNVEFSRQLCKRLNLKTKDQRIKGKSHKIFVAVADVADCR